jgi:hypothetical protein
VNDLAFAAQRREQVLAHLVLEHLVVRADEGDLVDIRHLVVVVDDGNAGLVGLLDARHERLVVDGHEHEGVRLLDDPVLDEAGLLLDVVGLGGRHDFQIDVQRLGGLLGADPAGLPEGVRHVLHEERDRWLLGLGKDRLGQRAGGCGRLRALRHR